MEHFLGISLFHDFSLCFITFLKSASQLFYRNIAPFVFGVSSLYFVLCIPSCMFSSYAFLAEYYYRSVSISYLEAHAIVVITGDIIPISYSSVLQVSPL